MEQTSERYVLVTGCNSSGLGFSICIRLIDEVVLAGHSAQCLHLVFTTRTHQKGQATLSRLERYLEQYDGVASRVRFYSEIVDLANLISVRKLVLKLLKNLPTLDTVILNAGSGGFLGLDWPKAVWSLATDLVYATTWPSFKKSGIGSLTRRQLPDQSLDRQDPGGNPGSGHLHDPEPYEPPLGELFCANVFGHYILAHGVLPLLTAREPRNPAMGRIIWLSSLESDCGSFSPSDIQSLYSTTAYEDTKRLIDLLALTSTLPSTRSWTNEFFGVHSPQKEPRVRMYVTHPGICGTSILPLAIPLRYLMNLSFRIVRWLGSPWHTVTTYSGACAPVWTALSPQPQLDQLEAEGGLGKWGSATDLWGYDRVTRTEVAGWGYGGNLGEDISKRRGRRRVAVNLTMGARELFEESGRNCWQQMEELRQYWERQLDEIVPS